MTTQQLRDWRTWLARVERRCGVDDVPILIGRLSRCLDELELRLAAEPVQLRLEAPGT